MLKMADIFKVTAFALSLCWSGLASSQAVNQVTIDTPLGHSPLGALVATPTTTPSAISAVQIKPIHHSLRVTLDPFNQSLIVEDTITFPDTTILADIKFSLNENLAITNNSGTLSQLPASTPSRGTGINNAGSQSAGFNRYSLRLTRSSKNQLSLIYSGTVYDLAEQESAEYAQSFADTSGIIGEQEIGRASCRERV